MPTPPPATKPNLKSGSIDEGNALSTQNVIDLIGAIEGVDKLIAATIYSTGLGVADCAALRVQDLGGSCLYRHDKSGMLRDIAPITDRLEMPLKLWLAVRRELFDEDQKADVRVEVPGWIQEPNDPTQSWGWQHMFPAADTVSKRGLHWRGPRAGNQFRNSLRRAATATKLGSKATPQALRDAYQHHGVASATKDNGPPVLRRRNKLVDLDQHRETRATYDVLQTIGYLLIEALVGEPVAEQDW